MGSNTVQMFRRMGVFASSISASHTELIVVIKRNPINGPFSESYSRSENRTSPSAFCLGVHVHGIAHRERTSLKAR
jgi:hypothetical protein